MLLRIYFSSPVFEIRQKCHCLSNSINNRNWKKPTFLPSPQFVVFLYDRFLQFPLPTKFERRCRFEIRIRKVTITEIWAYQKITKRQWHFRDLNSKSSHYRNLSVSKKHKFWCGSGKIIDFTQFPLFAKFERQWHFRDLNSKSSHYRNLIV